MAELNAAQVAAIEEKIRLHLAGAIEQMQLRKWAMEAALARTQFEVIHPVEFAASLYDFVTKPALEPFKS